MTSVSSLVLSNTDRPVRLLLQPDESKTLDVQSQLEHRSLLLCCCSLGGGLPFVPGIVLQRKLVGQFCRWRKCTHYDLIVQEYFKGVSSSRTSQEQWLPCLRKLGPSVCRKILKWARLATAWERGFFVTPQINATWLATLYKPGMITFHIKGLSMQALCCCSPFGWS